LEWFYVMISLSCFFQVAYNKLNWPTWTLAVYGILMVYALFQWLDSFSNVTLKRWKWNFNLLNFQQKKIRKLEKNITELKGENKLLTDEITGLHKMWMEQPSAPPMPKKPTKEEPMSSEIIIAEIGFSEGIDYSGSQNTMPSYRQETDLMDKSPL